MGNGCSSGTDALPMGGPLNERFGFGQKPNSQVSLKEGLVGCYDYDWRNYFEEIFTAELGAQEYQERLKTQNQLFKNATEKGKVGDDLEMKVDTSKYISMVCNPEQKPSSGKKVSHPQGLGLAGYAKVDPDPAIPESDFFKPGQLFEVRAKLFSFPFSDDLTKICIPSLSVKFADLDEGGPLDLICHSGRSSNYFSAESISDMLEGLKGSEEDFKKYLLKLPIYLATFIEDARILPDSFYHIYYHTQTVFHFKPKDGHLRLAQFRIVPADGSNESGRISKEAQLGGDVWSLASRADANQKAKYLYTEIKDRIKKGPVEYQVQIQLYEPQGNNINRHMYNATIPWNDSMCPWLNLMTLTLDSVLADDICEVTKFSLGNLCDSISMPGTDCDCNFIAVPNIKKAVYADVAAQKPSDSDKGKTKGMLTYQITAETGNKEGAGTDSEISISLIGTNGRTSYKPLDNLGVNDHEKGSNHTYEIKAIDIGELICAKINTKREGAFADWYLSHVTVKYQAGKKQQNYFLPCFRWFTEKVTCATLTDGTAKLPQQEKQDYLTRQRTMELQDRKDLFQWRKKGEDPGLEDFPGYIAAGIDSEALPRDLKYDDQKEKETVWKGILNTERVTEKTRTALADAFKKDKDPFKGKALLLSEGAQSETLSYIIEHWKEDEEFGRQFLQGINPMKITRVDEIPNNFPIENEIEACLPNGKKLEAEIKARKLYMVSYPELSEFKECGKGSNLCDPMCLLYVSNGKLVPIAIKLSQEKDSPIFTKKDDKADEGNISDWLLAKMWVKVADKNYHLLGQLLAGTLLIVEPFTMATLRNLASSHPVYKLLQPHIRYACAANITIRNILLPNGQLSSFSKVLSLGSSPGLHTKFVSHFYKECLCMDALELPKEIETRNVKDSKQLPGYFFRDDGMKLWDAINALVKDILDLCYKKDDDIKEDTEIQAFMRDLKENGLHPQFGLPDPLENKKQLVTLLTCVIFRASCGYAAVNTGLLDQYGFVPNAPPMMRCPPPKEKTPKGFSPEDVQEKMLPDDNVSGDMIALAGQLSAFSENEKYLGDYSEQLFTEKKALEAISRFQKKLKDISAATKKRNKGQPVPYNYMNPEQIPNCIAI